MNLGFFRRRSLRTKVTLFTLVIFLFSMWSLAFYASRMLRQDMQRLLGEQQFSTVSILAAEVNQEMKSRLQALEKVASRISPAMLGNVAALQVFLEDRPAFYAMFNGGISAMGIDGTVIADVPIETGRIGVNYMDLDGASAVALRDGKTSIGRPVMGKKLLAPVFVMVAPIRDAQGKVIGALAGVINLGKPNFLDQITENRYGKTGSYQLIAPQYRLIVTATDKNRIMDTLPATGSYPLIDRFNQGYEGTDIFINPHGVEVLVSVKGVPVAAWYVVTQLPTAEAFAPIHAMQQRMLLATLLLTLLAGTLTWWMVRRQLAPLLATARTLAGLSDTNQQPLPLLITRQDEIGDLIESFNRLLADLGQGKALLRQILDTSSVAIFVLDRQGRITQANQRMAEMFGCTLENLVGREYIELVHPTQRDAGRRNLQALQNKVIPSIDVDRLYCRCDQSEFWGHLTCRNLSGTGDHWQSLVCVITDITERKQMQDQVRQLAFYDQLTQLPNRRLLEDRMGQAMAASQRSSRHGALLFLDLDNFKALNDAHGHAAGDLLLMEAARRLKNCVREIDTVARFGGDEFVVLLNDLDADKASANAQAASVAEKIRTVLSEPYQMTSGHEGKANAMLEHRCTVSVGVVVFIKHEVSPDEVLRWADMAMYQAKAAGRNSIRFYTALNPISPRP